MPRRWVLNASPLISLCAIGQEALIDALADEIIVPDAVVHEILAGPENDRARQLVACETWSTVNVEPLSELLTWDLGAGETGALSFIASNPTWTAVLDDLAARRCARSYSFPLIGTLGITILTRQHGYIPSATKVLLELRAFGFRLDDRIISKALLETVGEIWI